MLPKYTLADAIMVNNCQTHAGMNKGLHDSLANSEAKNHGFRSKNIPINWMNEARPS